jgi:sulfatase modifying factor 1
MAGNVWEWCWDWYSGSYYGSPDSVESPTGPTSGPYRVLRGGDWIYSAYYCRAASRGNSSPSYSGRIDGFRTVRR